MNLEPIWREVQQLQERLDQLVKRLESLDTPAQAPTETTTELIVPDSAQDSVDEGWEQRLGRRWMVVVGVIAMIIAIGYEVRLAIEKGWITETMRCAAAVLVGIALFATGMHLRQSMRRFSEVVMSGGVVTVLIGLFAAHHLYNLLDAFTAISLVMITTFGAALLSWRCQAKTPIVIGVIGSYLTPLWVDSPGPTLLSLLTFLAILNAATVVLALIVRQFSTQVLALYLSTALYCYGWLFLFASHHADHWRLAFVFLTLQTVTFGIASLLPAWLRQRGLSSNETWALFPALVIFYYLAGELLQSYAMHWHLLFGLVTIAACFSLAQAGRVQLKLHLREHDASLMSLAAGMLMVLHLLYVHAEKIVLSYGIVGWCFVAAWLLRLYPKSKMLKLYNFIGLFMVTWRLGYAFGYVLPTEVMAFANSQFVLITLVVGIMLSALNRLRLSTDSRTGIATMAHALMLRGLFIEADRLTMQASSEAFVVTLLWVVYAALLLTWGQLKQQMDLRKQALWIFGICSAKVFLYDTQSQSTVVKTGSYFVLGLALLVAGYFYQRHRGKSPQN